ncbi:PLP-dependent aminotransferase family protein [Thalassomonas actiniarum]|uniref:PLP-dependent aminotransferase family protein n=1 Tax=Thalassomonas actiniarum TaxID=485447 RepID=A0AAE9YYS5_9GAMM|nr:PLP-dependent aminotransferase family protein [Thalassomonas actiniarum]WDE02117.1 PLP-dependent aminotransferase family protein [Thalassomonas actiniarum]
MDHKLTLQASELAYRPQPQLEVMNFLNEVAEKFPGAISFASGRPSEAFFDVPGWLEKIQLFVDHSSEARDVSPASVYTSLGQYGRTNGIINHLIAQSLQLDEKFTVDADDILVTNGAQEGMALCLSALFTPGRDVLLITDPTYIGITGLAQIKGIEIAVVESDDQGPNLEHLQQVCQQIKAEGKNPRSLYLIPDFNNPLGTSITLARRRELLAYAQQSGLLLIEDNPYGAFRFEGEPLPTLKALDTGGHVIYIGTFAKTICPGLRVGYLISDQKLRSADGGETPLIEEFSKVKSLISVNTGQIAQAIVGGLLLEVDCSVNKAIEPLVSLYRDNRDVMLEALEQHFHQGPAALQQVSWNRPEGGFFLTLKLPMSFTGQQVFECAEKFGVICVPMSFFSNAGGHEHYIRLSFSYVNKEQIRSGVKALADYLLYLDGKSHEAA